MSPVLSQEAKLLARLAELDATAPPAPTRGARTFLVDRALEYAAIARAASSPAARRAALRRRGASRARSKGYISIMVRLGEAFRDRPDSELARYRTRRITWKLAQRVVRANRSAAEIREALLIEATLWSPGGTRRPRHLAARHRTDDSRVNPPETEIRENLHAATDLDSPLSVSGSIGAPAWRSDLRLAARDPSAYLQAYERHLRALHRTVTGEIERALEMRVGDGAASPFRVAAQQSLRSLTTSLARTSHIARAEHDASPEVAAIIRRLAEISRLLQSGGGGTLFETDRPNE